ncbi:DNA-binding transcriptional regulator, LysR family [Cupriavidus necator]|uniref:LysR family transcriptional regulator n=1 Tax=Cupriavidus necator (strain ATCC 17699 / DSM 428 / KCTC 22496 / NCIMB 10442 / H16 / Stanier 337) TaxID=381666 RepID=Q0JYC3_CUPNH|nr:LysR family transcriptional regulator [Cupriavidus necator]QCC05016.1 LysR family transcriptional regulator [Cupriavidus necator H16]QQB79704.1 LysR family transcriptional regulator [Cupriavidus necator]WKA43949.1 LysR family transcriptional regulator [Cupriavidus necator]CAJ97251.1 transcriptional regulator, LysR-family [Cupriavidus necator H16]
MKTIEWKDWEIFCRVVEGGGFTQGAELAEVPKSSASAAVARLEGQLGIRLFERTTRRVRVTERGQRLYERVAPLFAELHEISAEATSDSAEVSGLLRISTPYEVGSQHLSESLTRVLRAHPGLRVQVDVSWDQPDLIRHGYDLAFVMTDTALHDTSFASKRVVLVERAFYAAPALIKTRGLPRTPQDLQGWPTLGNADDRHWEFLRDGVEIARQDVEPRICTHNAELRLKAALDGLGVTRLSPRFVQDAVGQGQLVRVLPGYASSPLKVYVLMPARKLMPASVRVLLDMLEQTLGVPEARRPYGKRRENA